MGCIPSSDKDAFIGIMEESEKDKSFHKIKQKGKHLSIKNKKKIIDFYNIQKQSRSKISQLLNIPYSTIWRVVKEGYSQFEEDKNIESDTNSYTKLNSTLKQKIEDYIKDNESTFTTKDIQTYLNEDWDKNVKRDEIACFIKAQLNL